MQPNRILALSLLTTTLLSGCGWLNAVPHYQLDIPQGNEVTADMAEQLQVGMSRNQVRFLLGSPMLKDPFHAERWDYVFTDAKGGKVRETKALTLYFKGDTLERWEGDTLPAARKSEAIKLSTDKKDDGAVASPINPAAPEGTNVEVKPVIDKGF
ncbi:outer membrane protein assembly factor BamE [Chitinibacteraceae bacterium HSL-7]